MADHRIVVSAGPARLEVARSWLARPTGVEERLVVASSWQAAAERVREVPGAGVFGVHRTTLIQLASELAAGEMARLGLAPLTHLGAEALAARATAHHLDELGYLREVATLPGFARSLSRTLGELRLFDVDAEGLAASGESGADLALLLSRYSSELAAWNLVDVADLFRMALVRAQAGSHYLLGRPTLLLDVRPSGRAEQRLLQAVVSAAPRVVVTLVRGDGAALETMTRLCAVEPEDLDGGAPPAGALERVRRRVFERDLPLEEEPSEDASLSFFSAPGEGREAVEIARRVRDLAAAGRPFDSIAVLLRNPRGYVAALEHAFSRAGVPTYFSRGTLRPDPAGRAFLALLACAAEDFSATRFAEYLSLGQVPALEPVTLAAPVEFVPPQSDQLTLKFEEPAPSPEVAAAPGEGIGGTLPAPRRWERLLVDAAVVGGQERWRRRLEGLAAELDARARELTEDEPRRRRLEEQRERLETLARFAVPLVGQLAALPRGESWGTWLDALARLARATLLRPDRVLATLAELAPMSEVHPVGLEEVRRVLTERLTDLSTEPPAERAGRVLVCSVAEAWGRSFDVVFLPGLAEGSFPRVLTEDPLLLDVARRRLDGELPTRGERADEERLLLRVAVAAAAERLVISYPNLDTLQGRARVPSFYALDLLRAAAGRLPDLGDLERRAAAGSASVLGWPSPQEPEQAIDDTEFDLAILEPLLTGRQADARGAGRYLLEVNAHLERSLRSRWWRWRRSFNSADGLVDPDPAAAELMAKHRLAARPYSPTALEKFGQCPYRFLLHAVHRLRPREELTPIQELDPLTRGRLFHEVQHRLLVVLREEKLLPLGPETEGVALDHADRALEEVAARFREDLVPAIPRVWDEEIEALRVDLRGWLASVAASRELWVPTHFELSFGLPLDDGRDAASREEPVTVTRGAILRGAIDLVERDPRRNRLRVTDHKTGRAPARRKQRVRGGSALQPLLYSLAAEELFDAPVESGRLFYCTRRGGFESVEVPLDVDGKKSIERVLEIIDGAVSDAFLPAAPAEGACRYCDYRVVCGPHEELRSGRKRGNRLVPLTELRMLE